MIPSVPSEGREEQKTSFKKQPPGSKTVYMVDGVTRSSSMSIASCRGLIGRGSGLLKSCSQNPVATIIKSTFDAPPKLPQHTWNDDEDYEYHSSTSVLQEYTTKGPQPKRQCQFVDLEDISSADKRVIARRRDSDPPPRPHRRPSLILWSGADKSLFKLEDTSLPPIKPRRVPTNADPPSYHAQISGITL